ncbi:MAG: DNA alkylation repair protein [bacterium]|nr:DNA alkylation repair protein [bacterium]
MLKLPSAPSSIQKGTPLKRVLGAEAIGCLAHNLKMAWSGFDSVAFEQAALNGLEDLEFMARGHHIAAAMRDYLPEKYADAIGVILASLTPPHTDTDGLGLAVMFYHPHGCFVANYGVDAVYNGGDDPFDVSMLAQYELTKRFTAEFSIRQFLIHDQARTLQRLTEWLNDPDPHVRRLCSEGTRPRLPWGVRLQSFVKDPSPALPILDALKDDESLYVRRSVANHLGDITKSHPDLVCDICERWLKGANKELQWVVRHALRYPDKKGNARATALRLKAK